MSENIQVKQLKPVYPAEEHENVRALLDYAAETYGDDLAFILKDRSAGRRSEPVYRHISYKDLREDVRRLGTGMMAKGISYARIASAYRLTRDFRTPSSRLPFRRAAATSLYLTVNTHLWRSSSGERRQILYRHRQQFRHISAWMMMNNISHSVNLWKMEVKKSRPAALRLTR